jgi:hypothetical protein
MVPNPADAVNSGLEDEDEILNVQPLFPRGFS